MSTQKLDDSEVEQLLRSGMSQMDVVRMYREKGVDVTQSAISQAIASGRINVDTDRGSSGVPWKLNPEHRYLGPARMLRIQARMDSGRKIGETLVRQAETWTTGLKLDHDSVIHYDPDTTEGFWRVPRRPGVDLWWVREPTLDDNGITVSVRPPRGH